MCLASKIWLDQVKTGAAKFAVVALCQLFSAFLPAGLSWPSASCLAQSASSASSASSVSTVSPATTDTSETLPFKYTGNLITHKFHRPRCPFCRVMAEAKRQPFHFRCQAIEQGYLPCRYCLPPIWTTVRATIHVQAVSDISK